MEKVEVPHVGEKCVNCPALKRQQRFVDVALRAIDETTQGYKVGLPDVFADAFIKASSELEDEDDIPLDRDELISDFLRSQGELLNRLELRIGAARIRMDMLQLGCRGLLRLRGVRDSIEYTVELCGSPQIEETEEAVDEGVRVRRRCVD